MPGLLYDLLLHLHLGGKGMFGRGDDLSRASVCSVHRCPPPRRLRAIGLPPQRRPPSPPVCRHRPPCKGSARLPLPGYYRRACWCPGPVFPRVPPALFGRGNRTCLRKASSPAGRRSSAAAARVSPARPFSIRRASAPAPLPRIRSAPLGFPRFLKPPRSKRGATKLE